MFRTLLLVTAITLTGLTAGPTSAGTDGVARVLTVHEGDRLTINHQGAEGDDLSLRCRLSGAETTVWKTGEACDGCLHRQLRSDRARLEAGSAGSDDCRHPPAGWTTDRP